MLILVLRGLFMFGHPIVPNPASVSPDRPPVALRAEPHDPIRRIAFFMGLGLVLLRFSALHQLQTYLMGFNLRLLYLVGIPAILGIIASGGIQRSFRGRPTSYWLLFVVWLFPATLFSSWKTGSALFVADFLRTNLPLLFISAGLAVTWHECRLLMRTLACAAVITVATARIFVNESGYGERLGLEFGTVGNPNDIAAHLLLILPVLLWAGLTSKRAFWRFSALAVVAYGVSVILSTASRGALLGLAAEVVLFIMVGTARQRIALVLLLPVGLAVLIAFVPERSLRRLTSFSNAGDEISAEADASRQDREYLARTAITYSLQFPLFGIGPGQFSSYEGLHSPIAGRRGSWHGAHNSYLEIASECGLPGFICYMAALCSTLRLLIWTHRHARQRPEYAEIRTMTGCILIGLGGFCIAITFVNFGYFFYLPAMSGLVISVWHAAREQFRATELAVQAAGSASAGTPWPAASRAVGRR